MKLKLSDIADEVCDSYIPDPKDNIPYIGLSDISKDTLQLLSVGLSSDVTSPKCKFLKGDILFGTMRPYFRKVIMAPFDGVCSTECCVIRPKNKEESYFVFYAVAQNEFIKYATVISSGDRPRTKWELFSNYNLPNFSFAERKKVSDVLSVYDKLIENNRRRIELLEKAAHLLYKEWLIKRHFPNHETTPITDGLPEGWVSGKISDFYNTQTGGTPSRKRQDYYCGNINWVKTQELNENYIFETEEQINEDAIANSAAKISPAGTLLVSLYGGTNIGRTGILAKPAAYNQACSALTPNHPQASNIYLQLFLQHIRENLIAYASGSAQSNINQLILRDTKIIIPSKVVFDRFNDILMPIYDQKKILQQQNMKLTKARDLLLPRLMRGA